MVGKWLYAVLLVALFVVVASPVMAQTDTDGDGVDDVDDTCPDTPSGSVVTEDGCVAELGDYVSGLSGVFASIGIAPLIAVGAVIGGVGLLVHRVMRAVK